jgi:Ca2+-binding EF-hand superfamily protein
MGRQDPFVQLSLGEHYKKRTKSIKGGGTDPIFGEEEVLLWLDQENWIEDLQVDVLDEDTKDKISIASTHLSLLPYMKIPPHAAQEDAYDLFYYVLTDPKGDTEKKLVACGRLIMRIRFLPAGKLSVLVDRAKGLLLPVSLATIGNERLDPFVQLALESSAVQIIKRSPADKDGGPDPVWQHEILFDIVDQCSMNVQVLNQGFVGADTLIGFAEVSLLPAFRNGQTELWSTLKQKKPDGGVREVGDIFLKLQFSGPSGIAYPQLREDVDVFDDTMRKQPPSTTTEKQVEAKPISTIPEEDDRPLEEALKAVAEAQELAPPEFTEDEIVAAFKFIDLDHNSFVGAAEIRHILVCMGEMITDEEIDMMISMVDIDGDGQVSFKEFRALVLHPNPAIVDMHKELIKEKDNELLRDKQAMAGKSQGLDLASFQRQKEMLAREEKKKMIFNFIADNDIDFDFIKNVHVDFLDLPKDRRPGGRVKFPDFCTLMKVEPITEYKKIHAFYDTEETGDMDLREFLLSLMNYVSVDRDERIKFSFGMFDEGKTAFISQREIEEILRGNHMLSLPSVRRKAETVMKQAHSDKAGFINLREFLVVSKKFPNILFPTASIMNIPKGVRTTGSKAVTISG